MKRKKVNFVLWGLGVGGIEVLLANSLKYLSFDFECSIYVLKKALKTNLLAEKEYTVIEGSDKTLQAYSLFFRYAKKHKNEIFHIFNGGPITLLLARIAGVKKIIYHFRGTRYWTPGSRQDKLFSKILWRIALLGNLSNITFAANSKYAKKRFYDQVSLKPEIRVIYNGFDISKFDFKKEPPVETEIKIVVVGRLVDYKNQLRLIRESRILFEAVPHCKIFFIGSGVYENVLRGEVEMLGLQDKFIFCGTLSTYEDIYKNASIVLSVSFNESFGNTLVEAVLSGTPILASNIPAHCEILESLPEAIIKLEEPIGEQLIKKISELDALREKVQEVKSDFIRRYSIQAHLEQLQYLYN